MSWIRHPVIRKVLITMLLVGVGYGIVRFSSIQRISAAWTPSGQFALGITSTGAAAADISAAVITIHRIELRTASGDRVPLMTNPRTFNLASLKSGAESTNLAIGDIPADRYEELRILTDHIGIVTLKRGIATEAKIPASEIIIQSPFIVAPGKTIAFQLNFMLGQSLHTTKKGWYVFAPVIRVNEYAGATVHALPTNSLVINGGTLHAWTMGMNLHGQMQDNFALPATISLEFDHGAIRTQSAAQSYHR